MDLIYLVLCLLLPFTAILNPSTIDIRNMLRSNLPDNKPDLRCINDNLPTSQGNILSFLS